MPLPAESKIRTRQSDILNKKKPAGAMPRPAFSYRAACSQALT